MRNIVEAIWCGFFHKEFQEESAAGDWVRHKCNKCKKVWFRFRM